jgi:hypothetical protein
MVTWAEVQLFVKKVLQHWPFKSCILWLRDIQPKGTEHNGIRHNDAQHNNKYVTLNRSTATSITLKYDDQHTCYWHYDTPHLLLC